MPTDSYSVFMVLGVTIMKLGWTFNLTKFDNKAPKMENVQC
jgi:hypothetical protein